MRFVQCFLRSLILNVLFTAVFGAAFADTNERIDRRALVGRHDMVSSDAVQTVPLGNGNLCFNADATGLQTFAGSTLSHWGWFSEPLPDGLTASDIPATGTFQRGRNTGPDVFPPEKAALRTWLFDNPRRMNLARLRLVRADGSPLVPDEIKNLRRRLDLWTGVQTTDFEIDGVRLTVETAVGDADVVAFRIESSEPLGGRFVVRIEFPYPSLAADLPWVGDFDANDRHHTEMSVRSDREICLERRFGDQAFGDYDYHVHILTGKENQAALCAESPNAFTLQTESKTLEAALAFAPEENSLMFQDANASSESPENFDVSDTLGASPLETLRVQSQARWEKFWESGGAVDLSQSDDPRWFELERRIVLSQYQMKISDSGIFPAAEVGLLGIDPWRGQFHMEMVWWHLAHWFLWGRQAEADRALGCYERFKPAAALLAEQLGYRAYKWQKSVGPEGRTAPWTGNQVLLWKEPHPIFFAELEYRARPTQATLEKWSDIINGTAEHMADYVSTDENGVGHLDPVMPPSELGITHDTTFDLAYWRLGLLWANRWRTRCGLAPNAAWEKCAASLAPPAVDENGLYRRAPADAPERLESTWEHPDLIGAFGQFPLLETFDADRAKRTLESVVERWEWEKCWGWDFPWTAMAAARLGRPDLAVEMLLDDSPRNRFDERGVNCGGPCPYLPGNGGLLYAVALMCAGWDEKTKSQALDIPSDRADNTVHETAPGFPNGWCVRWENLRQAP